MCTSGMLEATGAQSRCGYHRGIFFIPTKYFQKTQNKGTECYHCTVIWDLHTVIRGRFSTGSRKLKLQGSRECGELRELQSVPGGEWKAGGTRNRFCVSLSGKLPEEITEERVLNCQGSRHLL